MSAGKELGLLRLQRFKAGAFLFQLVLSGLYLAALSHLEVGVFAQIAQAAVHLAEGVGREEEEQFVFERTPMDALAEGVGVALLAFLQLGLQLA